MCVCVCVCVMPFICTTTRVKGGREEGRGGRRKRDYELELPIFFPSNGERERERPFHRLAVSESEFGPDFL